MPSVVAVIRDRLARARLTEGTRGIGTLVLCATIAEARQAATAADVAVVVVDERDAEGTPTDGLIRLLRTESPALPVLAYCNPSTTASREIVAAVQAGASGLLLRGLDDVGIAVRGAIAQAAEPATARAVLRTLDGVVPPRVQTIVEYCLRRTASPLTVEQLATALGVHRKTVTMRLLHAGMPNPRTLIGWCRLMHAARAFETGTRSAERVAMDLEFPSASAMRNLLRRYTGLRPHEVRARGGLECVVNAFKASVASGTLDPGPYSVGH